MTRNEHEAARRWRSRIWGRLEEPAAITAAQIVVYLVAFAAGLVAIAGGFPYLLGWYLEAWVTACVGLVLATGGVLGAVACKGGVWWLERIALLLVGLGWVLVLPSLAWVRLSPTVKFFILLLLITAVLDVYKRYRRIDWAYLDPSK